MCSSIPGENGFNFGVQERCGKPISLSYLNVRSWRTYGLDKTTAPHRERYIAYQSRKDCICLRCRCYCQSSSSHVKTAKFLHHEDNENNTFSGAASLGRDCTLPGFGAACAPRVPRRSVTRYMYVYSPRHGATLCHRFASP